MSVEIVQERLKRLITEVYQLSDIKDEAKGEVAEIIKTAISRLSINKKQASSNIQDLVSSLFDRR